jgi:hypothetical protein
MIDKYRLTTGRLLGLVIFALIVAGCSGGSSLHPAELVVARYYVGLTEQDADVVMDAVEPADRGLTGMAILGLLNALSLNVGFLGIDLGDLTAMSVKDLDLELVTETADYALVRAEGDIRYLALGMEAPFCEMHDVRLNADGSWYIDLDGPERADRLTRLLPRLEERMMALTNSGAGESVTGMFGAMDEMMAIALDLCE